MVTLVYTISQTVKSMTPDKTLTNGMTKSDVTTLESPEPVVPFLSNSASSQVMSSLASPDISYEAIYNCENSENNIDRVVSLDYSMGSGISDNNVLYENPLSQKRSAKHLPSSSVDKKKVESKQITGTIENKITGATENTSNRSQSPVKILKQLLKDSSSKSENDGDAFFNCKDLDELNQLILLYLTDQSFDKESVEFKQVLKSVKVKVLSDLLKRDLDIDDSQQIDIHADILSPISDLIKKNANSKQLLPSSLKVNQDHGTPSASNSNTSALLETLKLIDSVCSTDFQTPSQEFKSNLSLLSSNNTSGMSILPDRVVPSEEEMKKRQIRSIRDQLNRLHRRAHSHGVAIRSSCLICSYLTDLFENFETNDIQKNTVLLKNLSTNKVVEKIKPKTSTAVAPLRMSIDKSIPSRPSANNKYTNASADDLLAIYKQKAKAHAAKVASNGFTKKPTTTSNISVKEPPKHVTNGKILAKTVNLSSTSSQEVEADEFEAPSDIIKHAILSLTSPEKRQRSEKFNELFSPANNPLVRTSISKIPTQQSYLTILKQGGISRMKQSEGPYSPTARKSSIPIRSPVVSPCRQRPTSTHEKPPVHVKISSRSTESIHSSRIKSSRSNDLISTDGIYESLNHSKGSFDTEELYPLVQINELSSNIFTSETTDRDLETTKLVVKKEIFHNSLSNLIQSIDERIINTYPDFSFNESKSETEAVEMNESKNDESNNKELDNNIDNNNDSSLLNNDSKSILNNTIDNFDSPASKRDREEIELFMDKLTHPVILNNSRCLLDEEDPCLPDSCETNLHFDDHGMVSIVKSINFIAEDDRTNSESFSSSNCASKSPSQNQFEHQISIPEEMEQSPNQFEHQMTIPDYMEQLILTQQEFDQLLQSNLSPMLNKSDNYSINDSLIKSPQSLTKSVSTYNSTNLTNEELIDLVSFVIKKVDNCGQKQRDFSTKEFLDRETNTIAVTAEGKSLALWDCL